MIRPFLALLVAACLTACSTPVPGTPQADPKPVPTSAAPAVPEVVYQDGFREVAETFAKMREWDLCALHDITAARTVLGGAEPQYIMPLIAMNDCSLGLERQQDGAWWLFTVATMAASDLAKGFEPTTVGGVAMYRISPPPPDLSFTIECGIMFPVRGAAGISISASFSNSTREEACDLAARYAAALLPRMANPPLLAAGLTTPTISLLGKDPCLALRPAQQARPTAADGTPRTLSGPDPYTCVLLSKDSTDMTMFTLRTIQLNGTAPMFSTPMSLGTHAAFVKERFGLCTYQVPVDAPIPARFKEAPTLGDAPGMVVTMNSPCDIDLALKIVEAADRQRTPGRVASAPGALTLGAIN